MVRTNMDSDTWRFINTFAPWFSALGTVSAVIVSLYLARRNRRLDLKVDVSLQTLTEERGPSRDYVTISVVNLGGREATITGIGWKIGVFKKRRFAQIPGSSPYSTKTPARLKDGETAMFLMPVQRERDTEAWHLPVEDFGNFPVLKVYSLKGEVFTSVGKTFSVRADRCIRSLLLERITNAEQ